MTTPPTYTNLRTFLAEAYRRCTLLLVLVLVSLLAGRVIPRQG